MPSHCITCPPRGHYAVPLPLTFCSKLPAPRRIIRISGCSISRKEWGGCRGCRPGASLQLEGRRGLVPGVIPAIVGKGPEGPGDGVGEV